MADKYGMMREPEVDLQRHIINGGNEKTGGIAKVWDDDMIGFQDPMQHGGVDGRFLGVPAGVVDSMNKAQAEGLDSGNVMGDPMQMESANFDSGTFDPGKGADSYGPRFTGGKA